jgi:hypothetical protein
MLIKHLRENNMTDKNENMLEVKTMYTDISITQETWFSGNLIKLKVMFLQEAGVREALINLGWTPPQKERPAGRIFCGICGNEIRDIAIDLISNITRATCFTCEEKLVALEAQVKELEQQFRILNGED